MSTSVSHETTRRLAPDQDGFAEAARLLASGRLVALPTETVYGLGADATNASAIAAIYAAKERPRFNPLIAHVSDLDAARREGVFDAVALTLAEAFWPGPLTLVVPAQASGSVCDLARSGLSSVALRVPDHAAARTVLARLRRPVAAPSANRSGRVSPTNAEHVLADLDGRIAAVVDAGACSIGIESTVVACVGGQPQLLRPGGTPTSALSDLLGYELAHATGPAAQPLGPGLLASHYAPKARVRLGAARIEPGEAALLFGTETPKGLGQAVAVENLSTDGDLREAAATLFGALRRLDGVGADTIAVVSIPDTGLGEAINDRLARAAAPR